MVDRFTSVGEYMAAGMYEQPHKSLFFRKALGIRRYYENCMLAEYNGELLYPSGRLPQNMAVAPHFLQGVTVSQSIAQQKNIDAELLSAINNDFFRFVATIPTEHRVAGTMYTHSMPNYERILKEGLASYNERIKNIEDTELREGLLNLTAGIESYIARCVGYLESVGADQRLVDALKKVPMQPADNIYEAIVGWNFIMYLDNCDNLGCLGKGLLPYFNGENIVPLLDNLYRNLDVNNGYSMSLDCACPELTVQCLSAAIGKRRPMIELFVDNDTPDSVWKVAFECVRSGGGQPAFYNQKLLFEGLQRRFPSIRDEDIEKFCGGGCTESMLAGLSNVGSLDAGINLLFILEHTIHNSLSTSDSFDDFYEKYVSDVREVANTVMREISNCRIEREKYTPLPMRTLLIDDCIDKGVEYNSGGARYSWSIINFAGLVNVIDSMLCIKQLVFDTKKYSAESICKLLIENDEAFLKQARELAICHGKDIDAVNSFAHKLSKTLFSMTENGELYKGEGFIAASIQFRSQVYAGKIVGTTPDGRASGAPLCDSLAAIFGKDTRGPTALLNSVTSLDLKGALGVPVFNFNIMQKFDDNVIKALILGYMQNGGVQMQITCASKEELIDAYEHPELHKNLIVRVGGFSEYFNRLTDELKKMIIDRTVQEDEKLYS